ncbi:MAG: hypothetical protein QW416_00040 [Candidatus Nitrosocaldaceae archaeon]
MKRLLTGNASIATGAMLSNVEYIPAYPITPQTEIIEILSKWVREGKMNAKLVTFESEHSMITAAGAASLTGVRAFTSTSSQGLLYAFEMLYNVAGWRAPLLLANVSRAVAAPITLEPDHNDVLSTRDCGFIQIHAETCQEALDDVIIGYRIAEDDMVKLPVIVNIDGFYLSFTQEVVDVPSNDEVEEFLPEYKPIHGYLNAKNPISLGVAVLNSSAYSYFKYQMHLASLNALKVHEKVSKDFEKIFRRRYYTVEGYMLDDADYVIIMSNSFTTLGKAAIKELRKEGKSVGLLKIRVVRPFPRDDIINALRGRKGVAVFDQNISIGGGGILYPEVVSALYHIDDRPKAIVSFIGGLGGKRISKEEFKHMISVIEDAANTHKVPSSILLFTDEDWSMVRSMLKIAKGDIE